MIAEAVDVLWTVGAALLAWIAVAAAVGTLLLLGTVAAVWQAWRWLYARLSASQGSGVAREGQPAPNAPRGRTAPRAPRWTHSQPLTYEEAA